MRAPFPYRDHVDFVQALADQRLRIRILERAGADRVEHHRHAALLREHRFAQIGLRVGVVQDAAAAEDEEIEPLDFGRDLGARKGPHRNRAVDLVPAPRVVGVARENGDLGFDLGAQLRDHRLQDGLVAEIQPAVRTADADLVRVTHRDSRPVAGFASSPYIPILPVRVNDCSPAGCVPRP